MPSDAGGNSRPVSPAVVEDLVYKKDKGYRRYAANVDKTLSSFDSALQEWADYISFLGRLVKGLQNRPSGIADVPQSRLVAKRLAQCLDPRLPSGVHQKALEVYNVIFAIRQKDGLSEDLHLYLPGLSPVLSYASLTVKPALLSLFENHILKLEVETLRPALKALILSLLPGLDDEGSDEFERTLLILDQLRFPAGKYGIAQDAAGDRRFWQGLFLTTITSPSRRAGALQYLLRNLPSLDQSRHSSSITSRDGQNADDAGLADLEAILSPEPGLLVRCFAAGLRDEQLLVQRGFLDLLVAKAPLSSSILQQKVKSEDLDLLISAAVQVVLRREMSLNRRLWNWFLGPQAAKETEEALASPVHKESNGDLPRDLQKAVDTLPSYFQIHGLQPLSACLRKVIGTSATDPVMRAKPFRVCLSLMDRSEIGGMIVPQIFLVMMENVRRYEEVCPSPEAFEEVLRSSNVFFDGIQSNLIWSEICKVVYRAFFTTESQRTTEALKTSLQEMQLVWFILNRFNVREEEMLVLHMPRACLILIAGLQSEHCLSDASNFSDWTVLMRMSLKISAKLLDLIPERAFFQDASKQVQIVKDNLESPRSCAEVILREYTDTALGPSTLDIAGTLLNGLTTLLTQVIQQQRLDLELETVLSVLVKIIRKLPTNHTLDVASLLSSLIQSPFLTSTVQTTPLMTYNFQLLAGFTSVTDLLSRTTAYQVWKDDHRARQVCTDLVTRHWYFLDPARPEHAVEAARCLWRLNEISPYPQLVESVICSLMVDNQYGSANQRVNICGARHFTTLWTQTISKLRSSPERRSSMSSTKSRAGTKPLSDGDEMELLARPLSILLDTLAEHGTILFQFTTSWLLSLPSIQMIMDFLVHRLQATQLLQDAVRRRITPPASGKPIVTEKTYPAATCLYQLSTILNVITHCPSTCITSLRSPVISCDMEIKKASKKYGIESELSNMDEPEENISMHHFLLTTLMILLEDYLTYVDPRDLSTEFCKTASGLLDQLCSKEDARYLPPEFGHSVIALIMSATAKDDLLIQERLLNTDLIFPSMHSQSRPAETGDQSVGSSLLSPGEKTSKTDRRFEESLPPSSLLDCLIAGISSTRNQPILDQWIGFLDACLPFYQAQIFQVLIPMVECLLNVIGDAFEKLQASFCDNVEVRVGTAEAITVLNILLNGLEQTLAAGHQQLAREEAVASPIKSPEQTQGFFGNMVSGVFTTEVPRPRSSTANDRLTVLICFKDSVRNAFQLWSWGDPNAQRIAQTAASSASFGYMSVRLRNRSRRLLEHLFAVEPIECLETLIESWRQSINSEGDDRLSSVLNVLHALDTCRPKNTMPTVFNALYSRTSPAALDLHRTSTLTSELSASDIVNFLVFYTKSIDDDALDEIWVDCMSFLRNVLANPMPQRQVLPKLLEFVAVLGGKIDNTNFGEQRRMRKEIGDVFMRLLTATFTVSPVAFSYDATLSVSEEKTNDDDGNNFDRGGASESDSIVTILANTLPNVLTLLNDTDRAMPVFGTISSQVLGPTFRSRRFPLNVSMTTVNILKVVSKIPDTSKIFKKDMLEAFNDSKFFCLHSLGLAKAGWLPVLKQWMLVDKDRISEVLSRLVAPTAAGIMFGVGATSARLEADRKAQLNLRRVAVLFMAGDTDEYIVNINLIQDKIAELSNATTTSSPSSTTRAELYMLMRALILKISPIHLAWLWPILNDELQATLSSLLPNSDASTTSSAPTTSILQAAKLLDLVLTISPEDFQLREWLYVTDTVDAIYHTADHHPLALADTLADRLDRVATMDTSLALGSASSLLTVNDPVNQHSAHQPDSHSPRGGSGHLREPLLRWDAIQPILVNARGDNRDAVIVEKILRPFLRQLSILAFESTYRLEAPDRDVCEDELLRDLFDDETLV